MEFITNDDLKKIVEYSGHIDEPKKRQELSIIYNKLEFLCQKIAEKGFRYVIRKDSRKQSGRGKPFTFQEYQWAKIYPPELFNACEGKFAYIISLADTLHFHMMGIKEYQNKAPSLEASKSSWIELEIEDSSYEEVVDEFIAFDKKYKNLYIETGAALGIRECFNQIKNNKMEKIIDLLKFKNQIILQGPPGTGKTYTAKDIAYSMVFNKPISSDKEQKKKDLLQLEDSGQYKLIQFHPSYSYEDFVRGITVKNNESVMEYITENKVFAEISKDALANFFENGKDIEVITEEKWLKQRIEDYVINLNSRFVNGRVYLNESKTFLMSINFESEYFVYYSDNYYQSQKYGFIISFGKFQDIVLDTFSKDIDSCHKEFKGAYVELIKPFIKDFKTFAGEIPQLTIPEKKDDIKNYIVVIDEINRANLPSVLGELIYGLEYRGEPVESMYDIDGQRKIIIPPNLYIIGTMNTADRSVGHIDYAIRRRFAFVDILPSGDVIEKVIEDLSLKEKAKKLYVEVSTLFYEKKNDQDKTKVFLAADFKANEVQLGHSYFLAETIEQLILKLEYEIKPILNEYVKDGILSEGAREIIKNFQV